MGAGDDKKPEIKDYNFFTQTPVRASRPLLKEYGLFGQSLSPHVARMFQNELKIESSCEVISHGPIILGDFQSFHPGGLLMAFTQMEKDVGFLRVTPSLAYRMLTVALGGDENDSPLSQPNRELTQTEEKVVARFCQLLWDQVVTTSKLQPPLTQASYVRGDHYLDRGPGSPLMSWEFMISLGGLGGVLGVALDPNRVCHQLS